jgi:S1-C subfamily serine protease
MNRKWILISFCGFMVLSAVLSALFRHESGEATWGRVDIMERGFSPRQRPAHEGNPARQFSNAIADAVEKVMPSVVVIHTETVEDKVHHDLFGFPMFRVRQHVVGEGSGVIIKESGYVLTSWHLLKGVRQDQIDVVLNDGKRVHAKLVGYDRATDLAVLNIESEGELFPAVEFGDSDAVRVGAVAIAIGSPFSLQSSVTVGHVSQKGRQVEILPYEDFIQTDAAINEGNSGGPLIDTDGRLIGINAAIQINAVERGVGIAFAVPSNLAMVIANSLIETGAHEWPWVGAFFGETAGKFEGDGVPVEQVWRDTPAAQAGMQPGDVILKVNGTRVKSEHDIYRIIFNHSVGETLHFTALRNENERLEFELLLQEFPRQP